MIAIVFIMALAPLLASCQSASAVKDESGAEAVVVPEKEIELSARLTQNLERAYGAWKDAHVEGLLVQLTSTLLAQDEALRRLAAGVKVRLLASPLPFAVAGPNKIIYVTRGALASAQYENELAYLLSGPLVMIRDEVPLKRLRALQREEIGSGILVLPTAPPSLRFDFLASGWFEAGGLFDYGAEVYLNSDREAVDLPYRAKFDHRGAASLFKRWSESPDLRRIRAFWKIMPDITERYEVIHDEVAKTLPLRDPLLNTKAFEEFRKRVRLR